MTTLVLVHSPLVGPSTWRPLQAELAQRGMAAVAPALRPPDLGSPWWQTVAADVAATVPAPRTAGALVLVGHSGAGLHLPAVAEQLEAEGHRIAATLLVDALLPADGATPLSGAPERFRAQLDDLAGVDGRLPPWTTWWGDEVLARLLPDPAARATVAAECPRVPRALFDEAVPVPAGWPDHPVAVLSFTYEHQAREAEARGWVVGRADGHHLQAVVDPAGVADLVLLVLAAIEVRL